MAFDINRFRASFWTGEPALQSKFEARILRSPVSIGLGPVSNEPLRFRCESTSLPGRVIATAEYKDYGPVRKVAYAGMYNDLNLQVVMSDTMNERRYFERWINFITDDNDGSDVEYYDNYTGTIEIRQYGKRGNVTYRAILDEAYPINIADLPVSWQSGNEVHRLSVDIAYRSYRQV